MKNYEFWCIKKRPGKQFISEFIYEFMEIREFMNSGVSRRVLTNNIYQNSWKFMNAYMISWKFMNSFMNS